MISCSSFLFFSFFALCTQNLCLLSAVVVHVSRFPFPLYSFQVVQLVLEEMVSCGYRQCFSEGFRMPNWSRRVTLSLIAGYLFHYTTCLLTIAWSFYFSLVCDLLKRCIFFCRTAMGWVVCCSAFNSSCLIMWLSLLNRSHFFHTASPVCHCWVLILSQSNLITPIFFLPSLLSFADLIRIFSSPSSSC